jgi:hypothetical protein
MKHTKLFEEFLNEQAKKINLDKLKDYLINEFSGLPGVKDITTSDQRIATYLSVKLENDIKQLPDEVKKRTDKLLKNPPEGLLQIQASTGYSLGNALSFTMPSNSPVSTYKNLFHICSGKNVESIQRKGLLASKMSEETNKFKDQAGQGSFRITTYEAVFAVALKQQLSKVQRFFNYEDPHIVTFQAGSAIFYTDPFFNGEASSSCLTFSDIPASDIISIEPLKK